eukprot:5948252-Lingulodinium_polyedra.AAC.1
MDTGICLCKAPSSECAAVLSMSTGAMTISCTAKDSPRRQHKRACSTITCDSSLATSKRTGSS